MGSAIRMPSSEYSAVPQKSGSVDHTDIAYGGLGPEPLSSTA